MKKYTKLFKIRGNRETEQIYVPVEEIISFSQYELAPEMAAILDAHCAVYVWLGTHCCVRVKDDAARVAAAYLAAGQCLLLFLLHSQRVL